MNGITHVLPHVADKGVPAVLAVQVRAGLDVALCRRTGKQGGGGVGLRSDLHGTGVRVTSIEPGLAETEFTVVRTGGDKAASDALYRGAAPMTGQDIAAAMLWVAELPAHVNVNSLEMMPVTQSFAGFQIART